MTTATMRPSLSKTGAPSMPGKQRMSAMSKMLLCSPSATLLEGQMLEITPCTTLFAKCSGDTTPKGDPIAVIMVP